MLVLGDACCIQVVYPALDLKVKNVTLAYTVEHQDEVRRHCVTPFCENQL